MPRYEPAIDLDAIEAIDMHVHIEVDDHGHSSLPPDLVEAASAYFSSDGPRPDLKSVAAYYRERRMAAVVFTVDATTRLRHPALSSAEIADGAARNNDVLIPFGSVDPLRVRARSISLGVLSNRTASAASSSTPRCRASTRATRCITRSTPRSKSSACRRSSTPDRPASAPACAAGTDSSSACPTPCCSIRSPPTSPSCRSSWPIRRCRGRTRRCRSRPTSTTRGSTCPAGAPSTSRSPSCVPRTPT